MFAEDRAEFIRRDGSLTTTLDVVVSPEDDAEVRRVSIANSGRAGPRHRGHLLCRDRARAAGGRRRSSGLLQALRRDRVRCSGGRHPGDTPTARPGRGRGLGRPSRGRRRRGDRRGRVRDRPRPLPGPRQRHRQRRRRDRRTTLVQHRGPGARSGVRAAPAAARPGRRHGAARLSGPWSLPRARRCSTPSTSTTTPMPSNAPPPWPGRRRRCSCAISTSVRPRRTSTSVWRGMSSTPIHRCVRRRTRSAAAWRRRRRCGRRASRATCRSCSCASTTSRMPTSSAKCCAPTNTGD